ncbi:hypothetical protein BO82DRAFT_409302 [Aspergillus uvarum CBS 121591]|uniref:F-box domain-containing protein n=1 Tax=Aspergillus uvarum CBS 121591 TaxID=1448315 RepID=A0A319CB26_9EURO|nr:hypothetical protein BO82DRAFT_409302 [Aspergillus uvarum CBS 121591]PYH75703.1 hypothetical protein BO82DRAFT_409302 [Aspergillus uvarum CBS 121591]
MNYTTLTTELIIHICDHLELADWCAVRLTCKTLFLRTWAAFADSNFQTVCVLITSQSLSRLAAVAADENLRTRLEKKHGLAKNEMRPLWGNSFAASCYAEGSRSDTELSNRFTAYQSIVADHCHVLSTGTFTSTLCGLLACFNNLDSIGLRSCPIWTLLDSTQPASFPCFGVRQLRHQLPCHRTTASSAYLGQEKQRMGYKHASVFSAVVNTIITEQRKLRRLKTCDDHHCGVAAQELTILWTETTTPEYKRFLALLPSLETLHLCLSGTNKSFTHCLKEDCLRHTVEMVVTAAPSLRSLALSLCYNPSERLPAQVFSQLAPRVHFTRLMKLDLHDVDTTHGDLQAFLRSAATTLQRLTLSSVNLVEPITPAAPWNPEPHSTGKQQWILDCRVEIVRRWRAVWASLHDDMPRLRYLCLQDLLFHGHGVKLSDPLCSLSETAPQKLPTRCTQRRQRCPVSTVVFEADNAQISLNAWIRELKVSPSEPMRKLMFQRILPAALAAGGADFAAHSLCLDGLFPAGEWWME